ncbi:MAG: flagellar hook-length control protein FliK [Pseudomonadota bacterium]
MSEGWAVSSVPDFIEFIEDIDIQPDDLHPVVACLPDICADDDALGAMANAPLAMLPQNSLTAMARAAEETAMGASPPGGVLSTHGNAPSGDKPAPQTPAPVATPGAVDASVVGLRNETRVETGLMIPAGPVPDHAALATMTRENAQGIQSTPPAPVPSAFRTPDAARPGGTELPAPATLGDDGLSASGSALAPRSPHMTPEPGQNALRSERPDAAPTLAAGRPVAPPTPIHAREPAGFVRLTEIERLQDSLALLATAPREADATGSSHPRQMASPTPGNGTPGPEVVAQLGAAIRKTGSNTVELRLDPPELGHVRVSLTTSGDQLTAQITAERPEIGDMMRRHADLLQRELASSGFRSVTLEFGTAAHHRQDGSAKTPENGQDLSAGANDDSASAAESDSGLVQETGLNLRL